MDDFFLEIIKKHSTWLYYAVSTALTLFSTYLYIKKKLTNSDIKEFLDSLKEMPLSIKEIAQHQTHIYSEIKLQGKLIYTMLDTLELAHFLCDAMGKCIKVNSKWIQLTGMSESEALGHNWLLSIHPEDRDHVQEKWHDMVENRIPFEETFRYQHRITEEITMVKCHATDVLDDNGNRVFILGFSRLLK
jgi:PAS domain S-box-containing protein